MCHVVWSKSTNQNAHECIHACVSVCMYTVYIEMCIGCSFPNTRSHGNAISWAFLRHMLKVALCMKFNFARNLSTNFNINFSYLLNSLEDTFSCIWLFCWQHDFFNDHGNCKNLSLTRCLSPKFLFSFVIFSNTTTKICSLPF